MFIFSLNMLTIVVKKFHCLQSCETTVHIAVFDTKQKNIEAKVNVAICINMNDMHLCQISI